MSLITIGVVVGNRRDKYDTYPFTNIDVRAGTNELPLGNEIVGHYSGPHVVGPHNYYITFKKIVMAEYVTLQLKRRGALLVNGFVIQGG